MRGGTPGPRPRQVAIPQLCPWLWAHRPHSEPLALAGRQEGGLLSEPCVPLAGAASVKVNSLIQT